MRSGSNVMLALSLYISLTCIWQMAARPLPDESLNRREGETTVQVQTWPGKPYVSFVRVSDSGDDELLDIANW